MIMIFLRIKKKKKQSPGSSKDGQLQYNAQGGHAQDAWQEAVDESGRMFYHNPMTGETTWDPAVVGTVPYYFAT